MKIAICTGGGDCPGLNVAIQVLVKQLRGKLNFEAYGIRGSFNGLMEQPPNLEPLEIPDVTDIHMKGGTILGSSSSNNPYTSEAKELAITKTLNGFRKSNLDGVIVIGGEGTQGIAALLSERGLPVIGIPKTIDNDLPGTDITIGFSTASETIQKATEKLHSTAESHDRVMVLEVMGRNNGSLALEGGLAGNAHVILLPEIPFRIESVIDKIMARKKAGRKFSVIVVAEGAFEFGDEPLYQKTPDQKVVLGGIGKQLADKVQKLTKMETRVTVLGHLQRGGVPNLNDKLLAAKFADHAVNLLTKKNFGKYLGICKGEVVEHEYKNLVRGKGKPLSLNNEFVRVAENSGICLGRPLKFSIN